MKGRRNDRRKEKYGKKEGMMERRNEEMKVRKDDGNTERQNNRKMERW